MSNASEKTCARIFAGLLGGIQIAALALLPAPWLLALLTPPRPGRWLAAALFTLLVAEKIWAMLYRMPARLAAGARRDWSVITVGCAHAALMYLILAEFYSGPGGWSRVSGWHVLGGISYLAAVSGRYWAFRHLGRQWAVHLNEALPEDRSLVRTGPYAWVRHPLYVGACLEALSAPLLFGAFGAWFFALLIFVPLECQRARYEERSLRQHFGADYAAYARDVPGFLPWRRPRA